MRTERKGVFETNSSSTHAIVIPKEMNSKYEMLFESLDHNYYFGREECRLVEYWDEKLAYIYIVLKDRKIADLSRFKEQVIEIYDELTNGSNEVYFKVTPKELFKMLDNNHIDCYVDHSYQVDNELIERILNDKDFLKHFLFNKECYITIGGDEYRGYNIKTIGFQYDYDEEFVNIGTKEEPIYEDRGMFWEKLEEYKKENDVYLKGN